jgi:hypothetical protein
MGLYADVVLVLSHSQHEPNREKTILRNSLVMGPWRQMSSDEGKKVLLELAEL